jgi:hypothetical protein
MTEQERLAMLERFVATVAAYPLIESARPQDKEVLNAIIERARSLTASLIHKKAPQYQSR